ncbi:MAG: response regulator transcription factor [Phormidesmis sp.]
MHRILITEDEPRIAAFVKKGLSAQGFMTEVATTGESAITMVLNSDFDLMILDLGLPDKDGHEVIEALRGQGAVLPIIILSARDDIGDKVTGLNAGADDYLTKPFRFEELLARVNARLRQTAGHSQTPEAEQVLRAGDVVLNLLTRQVQVGRKTIDLPAREFTLAEVLFRHSGQVLSREQLLDQVWGYDYSPGSNIVDVYVGYLRKKLGNDLIETVRGMGYRLRG